ncbi:DUF3885 domain-containing protein [Tsukamurella ocularis]|uniref:DUF3885 domain-containing protein n=1 Tax=Tsukamurella ocularis TaxID=1970234 RepID=UPI002167613E|nr:hypothetical protein [Tsukamurella ocularis]MCS3781311.1 hypothetical protein [Tsukamurella ocularis]MCS3787682.1 hypothetical protein [Tsukamurella ocularis]MCS3850977.1 hypothetical protein [Tsukamurella ocularis]
MGAAAQPAESKRYPDTEAEYGVLLTRYLAELDELRAGADDLWVVTCSYSSAARPVRRSAALVGLLPRARLWRSFTEDDEDEEYRIWTHHYLSVVHRDGGGLPRLLRLVADELVSGVMITVPAATWVHHPYDGGADLILRTTAERDGIAGTFIDWLPAPGFPGARLPSPEQLRVAAAIRK